MVTRHYYLQKWALNHHPSPMLDALRLSSRAFAAAFHHGMSDHDAHYLEIFTAPQHPHSAAAHGTYRHSGKKQPCKTPTRPNVLFFWGEGGLSSVSL